MKKLVKKIIYIIPLCLGIIIMYGAFSGKLHKVIDEINKKNQENKVQNEAEISTDETEKKVLPPGKIALKENFSWMTYPLVDEYDPENKIAKGFVYGYTYEEHNYLNKLGDEQNDIDYNSNLPDSLKGQDIFNKDYLMNFGEEFEIKNHLFTGVYDNFEIKDNMLGLDIEYITLDKEQFANKLDENGKLKDVSMKRLCDGDVIENPELKFITFDIKLIPHSEWVTEWEVVPEIIYLEEKDGALREIEFQRLYMEEYGDLEITNTYDTRADYYDLGLYDFDTAGRNEDIYSCPMRKGEVIEFKVGYIIPVEMIDYAYIIYNPDCHRATEFSYLTTDMVLIKIT